MNRYKIKTVTVAYATIDSKSKDEALRIAKERSMAHRDERLKYVSEKYDVVNAETGICDWCGEIILDGESSVLYQSKEYHMRCSKQVNRLIIRLIHRIDLVFKKWRKEYN